MPHPVVETEEPGHRTTDWLATIRKSWNYDSELRNGAAFVARDSSNDFLCTTILAPPFDQ
jgi:hypothetical protein